MFFIFAEWSGEVRSITYSSDGKVVSVVYRVTLYGTDAEVLCPLILQVIQMIVLTMILATSSDDNMLE